MKSKKTQYYYTLPNWNADCYEIEMEVTRAGQASKYVCIAGFGQGMSPSEKAVGLLAAINELSEIAFIDACIAEDQISIDDFLDEFGGFDGETY
jgi:hypothetical protein